MQQIYLSKLSGTPRRLFSKPKYDEDLKPLQMNRIRAARNLERLYFFVIETGCSADLVIPTIAAATVSS